MKKLNFTKSELNNISIPKTGRKYYQDIKEKGLSLYITSNGVKTFYIRKRINGKDEKIIIGNYPDLSIDNARKQASIIKGKIAQGINPNEEKNRLNQEITFKEMFNEYMERYSKQFKKSWKHDEREIKRFCSDWFNKKISNVTTQDIRRLHEKIRNENGLYQANRVFEKIRGIYNKAIEWGWNGTNPCIGIKKFKEKSRDRFIQPDELPKFFKALSEEQNEVARDYIYISLYTGARKGNVLAMRWDEINFTTKQWKIPITKNDESLTVPLIEEAIEILKNIKLSQEKNNNKTDWGFSSLTSKSGHIEDPKKAWQRILKRANIKDLRLHDIRRTLGSYQAISGSSLQIIGKSLGHKTHQATQIYSRLNLDPVRESIKKAVKVIGVYKDKT
ncbi:tyrosine-type recombinase/integrase [Pseudomonadota bacterium]